MPAVADTKRFTTPDNTSYTYDFIPAEESQPTVLLIHRFPAGRGIWRQQVDNLTAAGFGVLAPDCLGYGDTDAPLDVEKYNFRTIAGHFDAIVEDESLQKLIGVGHDWSATLLSSAVVHFLERFEKLNPPGPFDIDVLNAQSLRDLGYARFGYWYFFNALDAVDVISEHLESFFSLVFPLDFSIWRDNFTTLGGARA